MTITSIIVVYMGMCKSFISSSCVSNMDIIIEYFRLCCAFAISARSASTYCVIYRWCSVRCEYEDSYKK